MNVIRTLALSVVLASSILTNGQSTPAVNDPHTLPSIVDADRGGGCDTVGFDPYDTGIIISDQYLACGVLFDNAIIHDYGVSTYGRIIHSGTWFDSLEVRFVQPWDAGVPRLVQHISFDNVIDPVISGGEIDYISVRVYDINNTLIHWETNTSASRVDVLLGAPVIARVVIDDSLETAYALDDFVFDGVLPNAINEGASSVLITAYPDPVIDQLHIEVPSLSTTPNVMITDAHGREACRPVVQREGSGWRMDLQDLPAGLYLLNLSWSDRMYTRQLVKQ